MTSSRSSTKDSSSEKKPAANEHSLYVGQVFYRFKEAFYSEDKCTVWRETYRVTALTRKGAWVEDAYGLVKKLVFPHHRKSFAYATVEAAWVSFQARKAAQVRYLRGQFKRAKLAREASKSILPPEGTTEYLSPVTHELHQDETLQRLSIPSGYGTSLP